MTTSSFLLAGRASHPWALHPATLFDDPARAGLSLLVHADVTHAATNIGCGLALYALLSDRCGKLGAAAIGAAGGVLGNFLAAYAAPDAIAWCGASTAVFALAGACVLAWRSVLLLAIVALMLALQWSDPAVATGAHLGGLVAGFILAAPVRIGGKS